MSVITGRAPVLEPLTLFDGARIAIVHEWVAARAGSEKVFEALAQLFPRADLYALTVTPGVKLDVGRRSIRTTWLDRWPRLRERRDLTLPLMPLAWWTLRESYDVVISSSHAFARSFPAAAEALHFSYVHAPARYLWTPDIDDRRPPRGSKAVVRLLKQLDLATVSHTDHFAANSTDVAHRIRRYYGRESHVIPPPVDTARFGPAAESKDRSGLLCFGRWVAYKRVDIAIRAATLAGQPLTVAGRGPAGRDLRRLASDLHAPVTFVESPSDHEVVDLMATHRVLLFPGREDFGIVPLEAAAAGLPTIAFAAGGAIDTVIPNLNGWLVKTQTPRAFARAIQESSQAPPGSAELRRHAESFGYHAFRSRIDQWIQRGTSGSSHPEYL